MRSNSLRNGILQSGSVEWNDQFASTVEDSMVAPPMSRQLEQVQIVGLTDCALTTSVESVYTGPSPSFSTGTMFTIVPNTTLEILTFEIETNAEDTPIEAEIYYRQGEFSGATNDPSKWTALANAPLRGSTESNTAIVSANDFTSIVVQKDQVYSFYLHVKGKNNALKLKPSNLLIGEDAFKDDRGHLGVQVGVSLNDGPFPSAFDQPADFVGRIHYKTLQECDAVRSTSAVVVEFAIDGEPEPETMNELSEYVHNAITALLILDTDLIKFSKYSGLEVVQVVSNFMGRSEEKCPDDFSTCSLLSSTVEVLHLPTVTTGELELAILRNEDRIGDSVATQGDFDIRYVGNPVFTVDFVITLSGVPPGVRMNTLQKRYFEILTAQFLDDVAEVPVYVVQAIDEVVESPADAEESRRSLRGLSSRRTQSSGTLEIAAGISASASGGTLVEAVLEGIGLNMEEYTHLLSSEHFKPGEINEGNSGLFFDQLTGASVVRKPDDFNQPKTDNSGKAGDEDKNTFWYVICIGGFVISIVWLAWRVYKDFFFSPQEEPLKLSSMHPDNRSRSLSRSRSLGGRSRSQSADRSIGAQRPRSTPALLTSHSDHPNRPPLARNRSTGQLQTGQNHAGQKRGLARTGSLPIDQKRGIAPTRSLPIVRRPPQRESSNSDVRSVRSSEDPRNQTGRNRGLAPQRSMPMLKRLQNPPRQNQQADRSSNTVGAQGSKNQAGKNGRGIAPSRSMPTLVKDPKAGKSTMVPKTVKDPKQSLSGMTTAAIPKNRPVPKRGVAKSRSMPTLKKSPDSSHKRPPAKGMMRSTSSVQKHLPKNSNHSTMSGQAPKKHPPRSSNQSVGSKTSVTKHPPRNQAGKSRGITATRSMPTLKALQKPPAAHSSDASTASKVSQGTKKKHPPRNQAGKSRGVVASNSLPSLKKAPTEVARNTTHFWNKPASSEADGKRSVRSLPQFRTTDEDEGSHSSDSTESVCADLELQIDSDSESDEESGDEKAETGSPGSPSKTLVTQDNSESSEESAFEEEDVGVDTEKNDPGMRGNPMMPRRQVSLREMMTANSDADSVSANSTKSESSDSESESDDEDRLCIPFDELLGHNHDEGSDVSSIDSSVHSGTTMKNQSKIPKRGVVRSKSFEFDKAGGKIRFTTVTGGNAASVDDKNHPVGGQTAKLDSRSATSGKAQ